MVEWRGLCNKFESFCHGCFCLIARVVCLFMCGCLKMKKFVASALRARNFIVLAGIDIARQNEEVLVENEQTLNFIQVDYRIFDFYQEMAYKI